MLKFSYCFLITLLVSFISHAATLPIKGAFSGFIENKGQVSDQWNAKRPDVLFSGNSGQLGFFLRKTGVSYQLYKVESYTEMNIAEAGVMKEKLTGMGKRIPAKICKYRLDINWHNCNEKAILQKEQPQQGHSNYYNTSSQDDILGVRTYDRVRYNRLYKGIDLVWYDKEDRLKYDYIVAPGSDYKQIQLEVKGADSIYVNQQGELVLKTPLGNVIEQAPLVMQENHMLKSGWIINGPIVSFTIEGIDKFKELVIDPGVRTWGTYYGGTGYESGNATCVDKNGNVYFAGDCSNYNTSIIATPGAFQQSTQGFGAFLAKFNSLGQRLWATYYAASDNKTSGTSCASDAAGNVYLAGNTNGTNSALATSGVHQSGPGGDFDAFLAKFDTAGTRLWATYYGGTSYEEVGSCATDPSGNVYLSGFSRSQGLSSTGSHQPTFAGGNYDAFLVKFNEAGIRQWGTYYGADGTDIGTACAADATGNIYLVGYSDAGGGTAIATPGSHQTVLFPNATDAFLVKFNTNGQRQWGTFYGGNDYDFGRACCVDASGYVYIAGQTGSDDGTSIATASGHQPDFGGGLWDGFIAKFDLNGARQWATYYGGGGGFEAIYSCSCDKENNVYVFGATDAYSGSAMVTPDTQQAYFNGVTDAFLAAFGADGQRHWSTYYGGPGDDRGYGCAVDQGGNIYIAGKTELDAGNSFASVGSHQSVNGSNQDAFFAKFDNCIVPSPANPLQLNVTASQASLCIGQSLMLQVSGAQVYTWMPSGSVTPSLTLIAISDIHFTVTGTDAQGCKNNAVIDIPVTPMPTVSATPFFFLCSGEALLEASGAEMFTWQPGGFTGSQVAVSPGVTTTYTVTGANKTCTHTAVSIVSLGISPPFVISSTNLSGCSGSCFSITTNSNEFSPYTFSWGNEASDTAMLSGHCYTTSGNYEVKAQGIYTTGCHVASNALTVAVFPLPQPLIQLVNTEPLRVKESIHLRNQSIGAQTYTWSSEGELSFDRDFTASYDVPKQYCITLIAADTLTQCKDSVMRCIEVLCRSEIVLPNIFTPNNDGVNEVFKFQTSCITTLNCTIYDRWGIRIRSWNGANGGWDGRTDSGLLVSAGVYFYVLEYKNESQELIRKSGSVSLLY